MTTKPTKLFRRRPTILSMAGLAAQVRADKPVTLPDVLAATLTSGLFGQVIAVVWCLWYDGADHPAFMMAVSFLAGTGGLSLLDLVYRCTDSETS